jgi:elongation factor P
MAIRVTEAKKGMVIRYEGELYQITKYDHVTPGNWRAIHHLNLKNMKTGRQKEVRMNTSDQIDPVFLDSRDSQYLYKVVFCDGEALTVQLPAVVELEVVETEPAARGDTVSNVQKPAKLSTGLEIKVPAHIKVGETVKVNTESGEFQGRA